MSRVFSGHAFRLALLNAWVLAVNFYSIVAFLCRPRNKSLQVEVEVGTKDVTSARNVLHLHLFCHLCGRLPPALLAHAAILP